MKWVYLNKLLISPFSMENWLMKKKLKRVWKKYLDIIPKIDKQIRGLKCQQGAQKNDFIKKISSKIGDKKMATHVNN